MGWLSWLGRAAGQAGPVVRWCATIAVDPGVREGPGDATCIDCQYHSECRRSMVTSVVSRADERFDRHQCLTSYLAVRHPTLGWPVLSLGRDRSLPNLPNLVSCFAITDQSCSSSAARVPGLRPLLLGSGSGAVNRNFVSCIALVRDLLRMQCPIAIGTVENISSMSIRHANKTEQKASMLSNFDMCGGSRGWEYPVLDDAALPPHPIQDDFRLGRWLLTPTNHPCSNPQCLDQLARLGLITTITYLLVYCFSLLARALVESLHFP